MFLQSWRLKNLQEPSSYTKLCDGLFDGSLLSGSSGLLDTTVLPREAERLQDATSTTSLRLKRYAC